LTETRRERTAPTAEREDALYYALRRCLRPACRGRVELEVHEMAPGVGRLNGSRLLPLCARCHARAERGDFSVAEMQRWKLSTIDYFENVGAE
jgi:hypothetical protein